MATHNAISIDPASEFGVKLEQLAAAINVLSVAHESENLTSFNMTVFLHNLSDQADALKDAYMELQSTGS